MSSFSQTTPTLVSWPRSGCHWVRIVIEHMTDMYCSPKTGFLGKTKQWGHHMHDIKNFDRGVTWPESNLKKVIYLYRNPLDTIFSICRYDNNYTQKHVEQFTETGVEHFQKWFNILDCGEILYVQYENLQKNPEHGFMRLLNFIFDKDFDIVKLKETLSLVDKSYVSSVVSDKRVVPSDSIDNTYVAKHDFIEKHKDYIVENFKSVYDFEKNDVDESIKRTYFTK
jgi:hypothetical protein